jgi:hypothetical protein
MDADDRPISVEQAISRGQRIVNLPVFGFLATPLAICLIFSNWLKLQLGARAYDIMFICAVVGGFIAAWLWWSITVPKWRLWAYEHVDDIGELKRRAVAEKLTWPDGSIFSLTEIKSAAHVAREKELESRNTNDRVA